MLFIKTFFCTAICCTAFFSFTTLSAQEYPKVNEVRVEFDGFKSVSEEFVFSNVQLRRGMNYNTALIDQSIRTLYGTGHFEFVEVKVENSDDGSVNVIFEVIPKYTIERITYSGNQKYKEGRLSSKGELEAGVPLDEYQVSEAADKIEAYYVKKGYPDVTVDYRIQRDEDTGYAVVLFDIDEGTNVKIKGLLFEGNSIIENKDWLRCLRRSRPIGCHGSLGLAVLMRLSLRKTLSCCASITATRVIWMSLSMRTMSCSTLRPMSSSTSSFL